MGIGDWGLGIGDWGLGHQDLPSSWLTKIPAALAEKVTKAVSCPVIGIGAGSGCDGQVLVLHEMLGMNEGFKPKFLRPFAHLAETIKGAVGEYVNAVKDSSFPSAEESY